MADGRVLVAEGQGPLVASPTWTRYDTLTNCRLAGYEWDRGRQSEFDVTETGTARVLFHDRAEVLLPASLVGLQAQLQLLNPVTDTWHPVFRGHIDDLVIDPNPSAAGVNDTTMELVGIFDFVGSMEMALGAFGDVPPAGSEGTIFYEDGEVDARIIQILGDAGIPSGLYQIFSGNVDVLETKYDPGDSVLAAIRDAADAEFPGVANVYEDKDGKIVFHGRFARFDPDTVSASTSWDFQRWNAATRADVTTGRAQIRAFSMNNPRSRIINSYTAWPRGILEADMPNQVIENSGSITSYGRRGRTAPDLIVLGHKTNGNTGEQECQLFADYYVTNYSTLNPNVRTVTFKSIEPTDARASATWALMCGVDISDVIHLWVGEADQSNDQFFVEGIHGICRPLNPDFDYVEVTPNLTPAAYFTDNVFVT